MNKINIAILYGGKSGEHEVSLRSASSVEKHLNIKEYNIHLIGITKNGIWYYQDNYKNLGDALEIIQDDSKLISLIPEKGIFVGGNKIEIDFILPILHGTFGEDGTMQGLLEILDIPYGGSGLDGSFIAMDKEYAKIIWERRNLPIVPFVSIKIFDYLQNGKDIIKNIEHRFNYPLFVKPVQAGSSVGVSRAQNYAELVKAINYAFEFDEKILVEPGINAREVECSVIGNSDPISFTLGEIAPSHIFYDYEAKYIDPNGAKLIIPANLPEETSRQIRGIALEAYLALNIKGFARVDFFIDRDNGDILLNEINTIPGFTNVSMFSMLCAQDGLDYSSLLDKIYEYGMERYHQRKKLVFAKDN